MKTILFILCLTLITPPTVASEISDARRSIAIAKERLRRINESFAHRRKDNPSPYLRAQARMRLFDEAYQALDSIIINYQLIAEHSRNSQAKARAALLEERKRIWFAERQRWNLRMRNLAPENRNKPSMEISELVDLDGQPLASARLIYRDGRFDPLIEVKIIERSCEFLLGASAHLPNSDHDQH